MEAGGVDVVAALVADEEASVAVPPSEGALKHPATVPLRR